MDEREIRDIETVQRVLDEFSLDLAGGITVEEVASRIGVSVAGVCRAFENVVGDSPAKMRRNIAMQHAAGLLAHTDAQIVNIAYCGGFATTSGFDRAFHKYAYESPSDFRRGNFEPKSQWPAVCDLNVYRATYVYDREGAVARELPWGTAVASSYETLVEQRKKREGG